MIDQTSPPFSTHVKHCKRLDLWLRVRFRGNPFKPRQPCRLAWKFLMKRQQILGLYGLENSTNQSALLTVYLFGAFLFSKPSNAHLFSCGILVRLFTYWFSRSVVCPDEAGTLCLADGGVQQQGNCCTFSAADSSTRWERASKTHCTETKHPYTSLSPAWVFPWASRPSLLQEKTLRIDKQRSISSLNAAGNTIDKEGSSKTQTHKIVCPGNPIIIFLWRIR